MRSKAEGAVVAAATEEMLRGQKMTLRPRTQGTGAHGSCVHACEHLSGIFVVCLLALSNQYFKDVFSLHQQTTFFERMRFITPPLDLQMVRHWAHGPLPEALPGQRRRPAARGRHKPVARLHRPHHARAGGEPGHQPLRCVSRPAHAALLHAYQYWWCCPCGVGFIDPI